MSKKKQKTNVMRVLDQHQLDYQVYEWQDAKSLLAPYPIFKTLVTYGKSGDHYVFVIDIHHELDLKKAAQAVGEKSVHMIKEKELLPLTGYVHGGCSPIGMKKTFRTVMDQSALDYEKVIFSAGRVKCSVALAPRDLEQLIELSFADLLAGPADK
ncbi:aminoacyl-tRNA deacylase [Aerococcus urinaehominis]|uniref:Cys-tRNA(Pro)/Cys-tRNA(Cys) deacylase n=1 Tax=Aerococcus urinaehominis TaxID=128944 RepID=A0A120IAU8_9LACT|nr:aminoacyl-tRNA deacylase [Aerococcus urinaehominis]AMB99206.1 aminoacyl-tRNA deacylase [Aerococcus urinaehominis]SDM32408.1 Cys-tRNA(Pro)/Cys-tRNA(Cys) deacylase [Aerococcus urinaehominis]